MGQVIELFLNSCMNSFDISISITVARRNIYPEPLENWNLDSAKAPAVRSIAKRSVLMQYGPLCDRSNPGALAQSKFQFANRSGYKSSRFFSEISAPALINISIAVEF